MPSIRTVDSHALRQLGISPMMEPSVDRLPERRLVRRENSSGVVGGDAPHDSTGAMTGLLSMGSQRFAVTVVAVGPDSLLVPVPFNPNVVWGTKPRHHIAGTVSGIRVRAVIDAVGEGFGFTLGPKSLSRAG